MFAAASTQAAAPGSFSQAANSECTAIRLPPTASLSFCQLAAVGQSASAGRTRRRSGALACTAARAGDRNATSGSAAALFSRPLRCTCTSQAVAPAAATAAAAAAAASPDCLDRLDQLRDRLLPIPVQHARVVEIEQRVLDPGESRALAALDDDDVLRLVGTQDRHAVDRAPLVGARHWVHDVVGADDECDVGGFELGVDLIEIGNQVVGHTRFRD